MLLCLLSCLGGVLESLKKFWGGVLGPSWAALGSQLGSQNGANLIKKSIQKSIIFWMPLGNDFFMDFDGFWVPKWSQVGTKMGSNYDFSENTKKRIWSLPASAKLGSGDPSWEQKLTKNRSKHGVQDGMHLGIEFLTHFNGFWEASWEPKWTKNQSRKALEKGCQK